LLDKPIQILLKTKLGTALELANEQVLTLHFLAAGCIIVWCLYFPQPFLQKKTPFWRLLPFRNWWAFEAFVLWINVSRNFLCWNSAVHTQYLIPNSFSIACPQFSETSSPYIMTLVSRITVFYWWESPG